jgi:hypothetical protein
MAGVPVVNLGKLGSDGGKRIEKVVRIVDRSIRRICRRRERRMQRSKIRFSQNRQARIAI